MTPREAVEYRDGLVRQLKQERCRQGLFQWHIGRLGGPSLPCVSGLEKGRWGPNLLTVIRYADALGYKLKLVPREDG